MKCVLLLTTVLGVAMAANQLTALVRHEVAQIVSRDPSVDVAKCIETCDNLFELLDDTDEMQTDQVCSSECTRALVTTTHHPHHTHAHHSHHGHHTTVASTSP